MSDEEHCHHHQHDDTCEADYGLCDQGEDDDCCHCDCCCTCLGCEYGPRDGMLLTAEQRAPIGEIAANAGSAS